VNSELAARRFVVTGKVQGVFFRASTVRMAEMLGIRGFARNLPDGRVEVLALGEPASLANLAEWLRKGPPLASVANVAEHVEDAARHTGVRDFRTA
jgi:acylphosphatase